MIVFIARVIAAVIICALLGTTAGFMIYIYSFSSNDSNNTEERRTEDESTNETTESLDD